MPESLDDRLAGLRSAAVPPLAPVTAVRARGEQRRSRQRAGLAAAAALTAVGVLGAVALSAGGSTRPDSLQPAPFASDAPPTSPAPSVPSVQPALLLTAEDVGQALGGTWEVEQDREDVYAGTYACPEGPAPADAGLARSFAGPGARRAGTQVLAYSDDAGAQSAWQDHVTAVARCGSRAEDSEDGRASVSTALLPGLPGSGPRRVYVRTTSRDCDDCAVRQTVGSLSRVGRYLVLTGYGPPGGLGQVTDGEEADVVPLADAAERRVRCADGGCEDAEPNTAAASGWSAGDVLLSPEAAAQAEQPGWRVTSQLDPEDGPVADPCREGSPPLSEEVVELVGRAMGSSREAGGSNLAQEVYRYSSAQSAADAFAVHEERYARCAEVPDDQAPEGQTIRSEVMDRAPDRLLVRRIPCMSGNCTEHFSTYEMVVRAQDAVTLVAYAIAEDGDPAQDARDLFVAVERRLREVVAA